MRKQIFQTLSLKMISIGQHKSDDLEIFLYPRDQKARGQLGRVFTVSEQAPYEGEKGEQSVCGVFPSRPLSYVYFRPPVCFFPLPTNQCGEPVHRLRSLRWQRFCIRIENTQTPLLPCFDIEAIVVSKFYPCKSSAASAFHVCV